MKPLKTAPRRFARDLLIVFSLLSLLVVGAVGYLSAEARRDISKRYIDNAATGAVRQPSTSVAAHPAMPCR
jgi:hypothetical protein